MAKYSKFDRKGASTPRYKIHPIWAGIGFLMIIIVPIISWAGATELVTLAKDQGWSFIHNFPTYLQVDALSFLPGMSALSRIPNFPAITTFFVLILLVLSGVLSLVYAMIYRVVGPPRYAPDDAPAPRVRTKKYTR